MSVDSVISRNAGAGITDLKKFIGMVAAYPVMYFMKLLPGTGGESWQ
jgi:hypothetical protein